ncbi:uncharacterized protein FIESC28_07666 [Fusarium coffeatum]|uniref:Uncharacterized protein n=1 Tax=Fusarium coffeatum TaxID=231269 RepID=A0A366RBL1_9HYPO|nr:uncharacterized protein FIESC28_07666 [Fusarium coffeatum]RBR14537.1 hypothetical protein FIESC28_07666 [Fusarium coffeatum]
MQLTWLCFKVTQALDQIIRLPSPRNILTLIIHHNDPDMEVAGLIIGIAGLFSTCLEAADRVQPYRSFGPDSHILGTRFQAAKIVLEQWGARVGFENGTLSQKHSPELDQPDIEIAVKEVLTIIKTILDASDGRAIETAKNDQSMAELQAILRRMEKEARAEIRKQVLLWIGHGRTGQHYHDSLQKKQNGTCGWIHEREVFKKWLSPEFANGLKALWINEPAGFGKTILCASVVEHLLNTLDTPVGYFFITSESRGRNDPVVAVRT